MTDVILLHNFIPKSSANGPGVRSVFWTQGCDLGCAGCINPATHQKLGDSRHAKTPQELIDMVPPDVDGITLSGGEPLQQPLQAISTLIELAKQRGLTVTMFTGYAFYEAVTVQRTAPLMALALHILSMCDLIIAGRYRQDKPPEKTTPLLASSNQKFHFPTGRYSAKDLRRIPQLEVLITIGDSTIVKTGVNKEGKPKQ
jgi:anaerobic ribonucleoside-triphosphate reductase activating protein